MEYVETRRPWTVLLYVGGEDALDSSGVLDATQTEHGERVEFIYQLATSEGTTRARLGQDGNWQRLSNGPPIDVADAKHLTDFIDWGQDLFPSNYTALFLRDHGRAWDATKKEPPPGALAGLGMFVNDSKSTYMPTRDLRKALEATKTRWVDMIGFDACEMGAVEVGYELRELTDFVMGSASIQATTGWPYKAVVADLGQRGKESLSPRELTESFVEAAKDAGFSVIGIELIWIEQLARGCDALAVALLKSVDQAASYADRTNGRGATIRLDVLDNGGKLKGDLQHLVQAVATGDAEATQIATLLQKAKVGQTDSELSVFFPRRSGAVELASYGSMELARETRWSKLVSAVNAALLATQPPKPPKPKTSKK